MPDIESLLKEKRVFKPETDVLAPGELEQEEGRRAAQARASATPSASGRRWRKEHVTLVHALEEGARLEAALRASGSSAASSTSRTTASIGTSRARTPGAATRPRSSGRASPATRASSPTRELHREVCKFANVLKGHGVKKGDRVASLHADDPRARDRHARLHAHRRAPQRSSSAASRPRRCATASTTRGPRS